MCLTGCNRSQQQPPSQGSDASSAPDKTTTPCPCDVEIADQNGNVITSKQTRRVGEKIVLTLRAKTAGASLSNIKWEIPGTIVKNYQDNSTTATVTQISDSDKTSATVTFYWVDGGDGRSTSASCICTCNGKSINKTASVVFDVKAPSLDSFTSTTDSVGFDNAAAPTKLQFGLGGNPGIKWNWKVTVPDGVDGWVKDVQTIQTITKRVAGGVNQVWTIPGTKVPPPSPQLDTSNPYSLPGDFHATKGFPQKVIAGSSYLDDYTLDSPGGPLAGTTRKSYHDTFNYYIMYKPDTADAIWVPVAVAPWFWLSNAQLNAGTWTLLAHDNAHNPSGSATTNFPTYDSNVSSNTWQNE
jgi:hypothetical protein